MKEKIELLILRYQNENKSLTTKREIAVEAYYKTAYTVQFNKNLEFINILKTLLNENIQA